MAPSDDATQLNQLGSFIRAQRRLAELSQRELAKIADLSDAYVSQLERGMHQPTVRVLKSIATALDVRAETMMRYAGWLNESTDDLGSGIDTEAAIRADERLTAGQKQALLQVYRGFIEANGAD